MSRKPGTPKTGGRAAGTPNKKTLLKLSDFLMEKDINLAERIWSKIELIDDPAEQVKAMMQLYKYVEAPLAPAAPQEPVDAPQSPCDIISIVKGGE